MIQRCVFEQTKTVAPDPIKLDRYGRDIVPGARVAYNLSGDVAMGTVVGITRNAWKWKEWNWFLDFEIHIQNDNGNMSRVKNPNAFVII